MLEAGAVGVNIEDTLRGEELSLRPVEEQTARIAAARRAADAMGIPLYLNARVDVYLSRIGDPGTRLQTTLDRAAAYLGAGADGVFVPGVTDPATVSSLAKGIGAPLNVLAGPGAPAVGELAALGAARISVGASIAVAAYAVARRAARELFGTGTYEALAGDLGFMEINALLRNRA
nr:hypothetical protein GCM10020093_094200 [Planobispora longispora]